MLEMHYRAFCKLLNIDPTSPDKYLWNPSDFGYQITRRRNFFRNFDDVEEIPSPALVFGDHLGPLLRQNGEMIPLASLLRTRDTLLTESYGRLGYYISRMLCFGTLPFGMERLPLRQKWRLEPRIFLDVNGNPSFLLLSLSNGRPSLGY